MPFVEVAKKNCPNIVLLEVAKEATCVFSKDNKLDEMWDDVRTVVCTQSQHYLEPVGPVSIRVKEYSTSEHSRIHEFAHAVSDNVPITESVAMACYLGRGQC